MFAYLQFVHFLPMVSLSNLNGKSHSSIRYFTVKVNRTYWAIPLAFSFDFGSASRHTGDNKLFENAAARPPNKSSRLADTSFVELCRLKMYERRND